MEKVLKMKEWVEKNKFSSKLEKEGTIKELILDYYAHKNDLEEGATIKAEDVVSLINKEFPDLFLFVVEESFLKGYQQRIEDEF